MRRVVVGTVAAVVAALVAAGTLHTTPLAFTLGVPPSAAVAPLQPSQAVCQKPIDVPEGGAFDAVTARVGTYGAAGSPLAVTVDDGHGRMLATGRLAGGYPDVVREPAHRIRLDRRVEDAQRVSVCLRNLGPRRVAVYGNNDLAARSSTAYLGERPLRADVQLAFEREPRSALSLLPRMLDRAALFRFPWLGAWAYVALIALLLVAGPWLLIRALTSAAAESR